MRPHFELPLHKCGAMGWLLAQLAGSLLRKNATSGKQKCSRNYRRCSHVSWPRALPVIGFLPRVPRPSLPRDGFVLTVLHVLLLAEAEETKQALWPNRPDRQPRLSCARSHSETCQIHGQLSDIHPPEWLDQRSRDRLPGIWGPLLWEGAS